MAPALETLINAATSAREAAYAPYSGFAVGAALLSEDEQLFIGANVENISFGLTMCAERVAVGRAIASGCRQFSQIIIVSDSRDPVSPCGACRQVLAEFAPDIRVVSVTLTGKTFEAPLSELLPRPRTGILGT
ncbi:MAG: cytidine deaminase [Verrucomicrobiota bacterium]|nr:cytidine deaminase [Verrucomicrobiota bacterium]